MPNPNHLIINEDDFIKLSNEKHNYQFTYNKVKYVNKETKVIITCKEHGDFEQSPKKHLLGQKCARCRGVKKYNNEEFIITANNNKYNYEKVVYNGTKTKITITCPIHGDFKQIPGGHLLGYGCIKCGGKEKLTKSNFIERSNIIHNYKYDYKLTEYKNSHTLLSIICDKHGVFLQSAASHLSGCGCPTCNESKGEREISIILDKLCIKYTREYKFKKCKYKKELRFDFYLPDINYCIEFNGRQHYEEVPNFGGRDEFEEIKKRDNIKIDFCKINNINLLIIKYNDIDDIDKIIKSKFITEEQSKRVSDVELLQSYKETFSSLKLTPDTLERISEIYSQRIIGE